MGGAFRDKVAGYTTVKYCWVCGTGGVRAFQQGTLWGNSQSARPILVTIYLPYFPKAVGLVEASDG
jgi:hypothetical protein